MKTYKIPLFLVVILSLGGCISAPKTTYSCDESCAMQNMVCAGMSFGRTSGSTTKAHQYGDGLAAAINPTTYDHSTSSQSFQCVRDESKAARIAAYRDIAAARLEYNETRCGTYFVTLAHKESPVHSKCDGLKAKLELLSQSLTSRD